MTSVQNIAAHLTHRASVAPYQIALYAPSGQVRSGKTGYHHLTYAQLDSRARAIAATLQRTTHVGDRVLLVYPAGLDFVVAFFACLYAGVIAVPAYPPIASRLARTLPRLLDF